MLYATLTGLYHWSLVQPTLKTHWTTWRWRALSIICIENHYMQWYIMQFINSVQKLMDKYCSGVLLQNLQGL